MAQYQTNKPNISFDTSKFDKKKESSTQLNSGNKSKNNGKKEIQDKIKRQEEEIEREL